MKWNWKWRENAEDITAGSVEYINLGSVEYINFDSEKNINSGSLIYTWEVVRFQKHIYLHSRGYWIKTQNTFISKVKCGNSSVFVN